jgi:hypothetical protein
MDSISVIHEMKNGPIRLPGHDLQGFRNSSIAIASSREASHADFVTEYAGDLLRVGRPMTIFYRQMKDVHRYESTWVCHMIGSLIGKLQSPD